MVRVSFKFSAEKVKAAGRTEEELLEPFREKLKPYGVQEVSPGVFQKEGKDGLVVLDFPLDHIEENLFYLQLLDEWILDIDGDVEDCKEELISYYREHGYALKQEGLW